MTHHHEGDRAGCLLDGAAKGRVAVGIELVGDRVADATEDEAAGAAAEQVESEGSDRAHRIADGGVGGFAEMGGEGDLVAGDGVGGPVFRGGIKGRGAVAAQVRRDDAVAGVGESLGDLGLEPVEVCVAGEAVEEEDDRAFAELVIADRRAVEGGVGFHLLSILGAGGEEGEDGEEERERGVADHGDALPAFMVGAQLKPREGGREGGENANSPL